MVLLFRKYSTTTLQKMSNIVLTYVIQFYKAFDIGALVLNYLDSNIVILSFGTAVFYGTMTLTFNMLGS